MFTQNGDASQTDAHQNARQIKVRYKIDGDEVEVEGHPDDVNPYISLFAHSIEGKRRSKLTNGTTQPESENQSFLPGFDKQNAPPSANGSAPLAVDGNAPTTEIKPPDFLTFYTQKAPKKQYEEVVTITYYYVKYKGFETLTYEQYEEAYTLLKRAAVTSPTDIGGTVRNTFNRTKYLFSPERGQFGITTVGEAYVENEMEK